MRRNPAQFNSWQKSYCSNGRKLLQHVEKAASNPAHHLRTYSCVFQHMATLPWQPGSSLLVASLPADTISLRDASPIIILPLHNSYIQIRSAFLPVTPLASSHHLAMGSDYMRIPVGASSQHHLMPVEHGHQHHTSQHRHLTLHVSHSLHLHSFPLS